MLAEWLLVWMTMTGAVPEIAEFPDQRSCEAAKADKIRYGYRHISACIRFSDIRARQLSGLKPFDDTVGGFRTDSPDKKFGQSSGVMATGQLTPKAGQQPEEQAMSPAVWFLFFTVVTGSGDVVQTSRHEYTTLAECENARQGAVEWDKPLVTSRIKDNARSYVTECKFGPPHNARTEEPGRFGITELPGLSGLNPLRPLVPGTWVLYSVSMSGHGADAAVIPIRTDHPTKRACLIERRKLELQRDKARKMGRHVLLPIALSFNKTLE